KPTLCASRWGPLRPTSGSTPGSEWWARDSDSAARISCVSLYLGFDSSTQSLTGIVLEIGGSERRVVFQRSLNFDRDFPHYGTHSGVLPHADPLVATSSPLLWAEALDRFMGILARDSRLDLRELRAVSGAAQQHGSVYLNGAATAGLARLDPRQPLAPQLSGTLSRAEAPIWMDSSTTAQCAAIAGAVLGGDRPVVALLGGALRPAARHRDRLERRQPEQPHRRGACDPRADRHLPRHERYAVRAVAGPADRRVGRESRVRRADRRLHGAGVLQERLARPRAGPRRVRSRLGRLFSGVA